jgi:fumarylacetoacetase
LLPLADIELLMPIDIGDYTDFYASIQHATHVGSIMRPDNPLMPNYKHMPIGYHGRSSSVVITGTPIAWPAGQINTQAGLPQWGISNSLDYELELGAVIGKGNHLGNPIPIHQAGQHIFGFVLLNDWSARDIQKWEYQPLGPFNGKNFASTISPWVVTKEALEPFEIAADHHERMPPLLSYLVSPANHNLDISVEAYLSSADMRKAGTPPLRICQGNTKDLYWTFDQMTCHHTVSGCNLRPGDLLGSGTISGSTKDSLGCLLERLAFKLPPLELPDGTTRQYLKEGDEIILRAYTSRPGYPRIGFGECRGIVSTKS